jgi:hypothetical protein
VPDAGGLHRGSAPLAPGVRHRQPLVDPCEVAAEGLELGGLDASCREQRIELMRARKLPHADRVLDDAAGPADAWLSPPPPNRAHPEIQLGREAAVEAHLLVTQLPPLRGTAQVDEGVLHRAFDLVGKPPGQQYPGDVRLDEIDCPHRVRVGSRIKEGVQVIRKGAHRAVHVKSAADRSCHRPGLLRPRSFAVHDDP